MCYHTKQSKLAVEIQSRFNAIIDSGAAFKPQESINGFDFPLTPVITDEQPEIITHFNWGLVPSWAKEDGIKKSNLNAKIETIEEKPSFKSSINKRCLVIANGFYEWQWLDSKGKNKNKFEIGIGNEDLFAFAGIYSKWIDKTTGEAKNTYAIVTTEANSLMTKIHNVKKRMPILLKPEDEIKWLQNQPVLDFAFPYEVRLVSKNLNQNSLF
jgi:putative SOS response-associated peptidase YedK